MSLDQILMLPPGYGFDSAAWTPASLSSLVAWFDPSYGGGGGHVAYNADETAIANQIFGAVALSVTASGTLDAGVVTITTAGNGPISDTALSPVSDVLTLPEVTHSIA